MSESTMLMSLPTETLTAIVLFAVAVDMGIPWVLSETCHRLRAIVLSLPQAWTRVHLAPVTFYESKIGPPPPATEGEDADDDVDLPGLRLARPLDLWLQRMGDNPFELHIEFCDLPSRALRIGKVASEIRKHGSRLRAISVSGESPELSLDMLNTVLQRLSELPNPPQVDVHFTAWILCRKNPSDLVRGCAGAVQRLDPDQVLEDPGGDLS